MHSAYTANNAGPGTVVAGTASVTSVAVLVALLVVFHWYRKVEQSFADSPNAYDARLVHWPFTLIVKAWPDAGVDGVSENAIDGDTAPLASIALFSFWPRVLLMPVSTACVQNTCWKYEQPYSVLRPQAPYCQNRADATAHCPIRRNVVPYGTVQAAPPYRTSVRSGYWCEMFRKLLYTTVVGDRMVYGAPQLAAAPETIRNRASTPRATESMVWLYTKENNEAGNFPKQICFRQCLGERQKKKVRVLALADLKKDQRYYRSKPVKGKTCMREH